MKPTDKSRRLTSMTTVLSLGLFLVIIVGTKPALAGEAPLVRANYAAFSGAFAPLWIAADRSLFGKYGLNVDIRYIAPPLPPKP